jgi:hypothetical protein
MTPTFIDTTLDKLEDRRMLAGQGVEPHDSLDAAFVDPMAIQPQLWMELSQQHILPPRQDAANAEPAEPLGRKPLELPQRVNNDSFRVWDATMKHTSVMMRDAFDGRGIEMVARPADHQLTDPAPEGGTHSVLSWEKINHSLQNARPNSPYIINIEKWKTDIRRHPVAEVDASIERFTTLIQHIRNERPDLEIGIYSVAPIRDYWSTAPYRKALDDLANNRDTWQARNLPKLKARFDGWQEANAYLQPLVDQLDFTNPSLYTFYEDRTGWQHFAEENIAAAQAYGKPVVPMVWMLYHNASNDRPLDPIEGDFFRQQLDVVRKNAAGVAIYNGFASVDTSDPWGVATSEFLHDLRAGNWSPHASPAPHDHDGGVRGGGLGSLFGGEDEED